MDYKFKGPRERKGGQLWGCSVVFWGMEGMELEDMQCLPVLMRSSDFILNSVEDFKRG